MSGHLAIGLSVPLFFPIAIALISAIFPQTHARFWTLLGTLGPLVFALIYLFDFQRGSTAPALQYVTDDTWIKQVGIHYKLAIDGLNLWLVALTALLFTASALWLIFRPVERPKLFGFHLALAETAVIGAFIAQDLALFVAFFDLMLVPFYFIVGLWGGADRIRATTKLVIYTLFGSLLMLAGAVATAVLSASQHHAKVSFVLSDLAQRPLVDSTQRWVFVAFALAFLIKMPSFPFHGWMPDTYRNMPLPALALFSGVLSKVGAFGFLRIVFPILPGATVDFQTTILLLALASVIYGSIQAFTQTDTRLILGYSSIAQLGFITLGLFALRPEGSQGALLQMVNHGLVVAVLFFIIVLLSERAAGSADLKELGGIAFRAPILAALFLVAALATLAMPGSANFAGEFLILLGLFKSKLTFAVIAFSGVVMASVYMLRAFIRAMHNRPAPEVTSRDLTRNDAYVLFPLVGVIIAFAFYPQRTLSDSQKRVQTTVETVQKVEQSP